ncbi:uncharacterized protein LOC126679551 isoform X2 [Mercurialis annua]|uniref:uncharacterized protein LOC126679551 isoform X2 n=1 Tax=Mercurialis annua TaxID=3986 RepID=UPI00215F06DD|nr:uncharacterized protein LOC126679551 isoform X2 [Mercurialis annua]
MQKQNLISFMAPTAATNITASMEQSQIYGSKRRENLQEPTSAGDFSLREWGLKAQISRENTRSRRFSGSHIRSFREDAARSFRSSITISSTASSPGYPLKDEIDPSTYSFTTALKALQARAVGYNSWECSSPDGFALNSKWNEAEKYICNPLSGEVPMECLSAKTLSGRSFRSSTINRITMSAPLVYSSSNPLRQIYAKQQAADHESALHFPIQEKKMEGMSTRDVGTQSTPPDLSSTSSSPASTPPMTETYFKKCENSPSCKGKLKDEEKVEDKETKEKEETEKVEVKKKEMRKCSSMQGGCLSWMRKRQRDKHKSRNKILFLFNHQTC